MHAPGPRLPWLFTACLALLPFGVAAAKLRTPTPATVVVRWDAEGQQLVTPNGGIVSTDGQYAGSHRKYSGLAGQQPLSPPWQRVTSPVRVGSYAYKVVSQAGNGRNEQRLLRDWDPTAHGARWFQFAVYIDPRTDRARSGSHFFFAQVHQSVDAGNPPIFMSWTGLQWELVTRTDDGRVGVNRRRVVARGPMEKGRWYVFRLKARPALGGAAELELLQRDGSQWVSRPIAWGTAPRNIGYKFSKTTTGSLTPWNHFNWKVGIYRGGHSADAITYVDGLSVARTQGDL